MYIDEEGYLADIQERVHIKKPVKELNIQTMMEKHGLQFPKVALFHEYVGIHKQHFRRAQEQI